MRRVAVISLSLLLGACFESPSDLLGPHANTIERTEPIFALRNQIYYLDGSGKSVSACRLSQKSDLGKPCNETGRVSIERTRQGNYIVQVSQQQKFIYGLWFRTDESRQGKGGSQCFVWLGDGIVGQVEMSLVTLQWQGTPLFTKLASEVRSVATESNIDRRQLLRIAQVYEDNLAPITSDRVTCIGDRVWLEPTGMQITGDNRHLRQFEPGTPATN